MATSDIGVGLKVDGEKEFKQAISDINREVKLLTNEMKLVTETFKGNAQSQDALREKSRVLNEQIDKQNEKIRKLQEALDNAKEEYGENSRQAQNWQNSLLIAQTQLAKYNNELEDVTRQLDEYGTEARQADNSTKDVGDSMRNAEGGASKFEASISSLTIAMGHLVADLMRQAVSAMVDFGKQSIQLASDLQEVQNVVDVTFGEGADSIYDWSKTASTQFGLTALQAQQYSSRIGAGLKAMGITSEAELNDMSTTLAGLSGDLASFYNLSADETYTKIFSGVISGETEGLKSLGVVMTQTNLEAFAMQQGITKAYKAMTASEKAQLRYQYLLYATSDAQGDFARTSDSYANQVKILQMNLENLGAVIGQAILPMLTDVVSGINDFVSRLTEAFSEGGFQGLMNEAMTMFVEFIESLAEMMPQIAEFAVDLIITFVNALIADDNLARLINAGITLIVNLAIGLAEAVYTQLIPQVGTLMYDTASAFADPANLAAFVDAGKAIASSIWDGVKSLFNSSVFGAYLRGVLTGGIQGGFISAGSYLYDNRGSTNSNVTTNFNINTSSVGSGVIDQIVSRSRRVTTMRGTI